MLKRRWNADFRQLRFVLIYAALLSAAVACQGKNSLFNGKVFRERAVETPAPSDFIVEKTFFGSPGKPKTFLCGWAPENMAGMFAPYFFGYLVHASPHCNLEFEITKEALVGRLVNPRVAKADWVKLIIIPIREHFYYERARDSHGRQTNEWIRNSSRSDESARPMIDLDLSNTQILDHGFGQFFNRGLGAAVTGLASDIERDKSNGFLGYTLSIHSATFPTLAQAQIRVNFLAFESDRTFKKTPYHQENSRYFNILHVMSQYFGGQEELYAAKWDLQKTTKLYISGAEDKRVQELLVSAVEKWNQTFIETGVVTQGKRAFDPVLHSPKHDFDLRYPGITWVNSSEVAMNAPLGIGQAHADVSNGKILWGRVILYGGSLEKIISRNAPAMSTSGSESRLSFPLANLGLSLPDSVKSIFEAFRIQTLPDVQLGMRQGLAALAQERMQVLDSGRGDARSRNQVQEEIKLIKGQLESISRNGDAINKKIADDAAQLVNSSSALMQRSFNGRTLVELLGYAKKGAEIEKTDANSSQMQRALSWVKSKAESKVKAMAAQNLGQSWFPDTELTGQALWASAVKAEAHSFRSFSDMYDGLVMELTLHELGHMFGLGHQFKENILPAKGTVPSKIYNDLVEQATAEKHFTNSTSVMGYKSAATWLLSDAKTIVPGPHDRLVLRYLYLGEYSAFDAAKDEFVFLKTPANGMIPEFTDGKRTAYFPSCNDYEATLSTDPFCNRWDRGHSAVEITRSYFERLNNNLAGMLYQFVGGTRSSPEVAEYGLWQETLEVFSHVRSFYDEMRRRLATDVRLKPIWDEIRLSEDALFEFSQACDAGSESEIEHPALKRLFFANGQAVNGDIRDLCRASKLTLKEMKFLVNLHESDYTRVDAKERFIMGGYLVGDAEKNTRQMFGTWYQLTNFPLKAMAFHTLTTAQPFLDFGFIANPTFNSPDDRFLYRTLFPREYTRLVADAFNSNLRFEVLDGDDRTSLGKLALVAPWMLASQRLASNDPGLIPGSMTRALESQTNFNFSVVAVVLEAQDPSTSKKGVKPGYFQNFKGTIYILGTQKTQLTRDVYVLPQGEVVVRMNNAFVIPVTRLRFLDSKTAYVLAYKIDYDYEDFDRLISESVKSSLNEKYKKVVSQCVEGGLADMYGSSDFEGFYIPEGIHFDTNREKSRQFLMSVDEQFAKYNRTRLTANQRLGIDKVCELAMKGAGQVGSAAALASGFWLPMTYDYMLFK